MNKLHLLNFFKCHLFSCHSFRFKAFFRLYFHAPSFFPFPVEYTLLAPSYAIILPETTNPMVLLSDFIELPSIFHHRISLIIVSWYCFVTYCLSLLGRIYYQIISASEMPGETNTQSTSKDTGIILALVLVPIVVLFTILALALVFAEYCNAGVSFCLRCKCFRQPVKSKQKRSRSDPPRFTASMKTASDCTDIELDTYQRPVELHHHV